MAKTKSAASTKTKKPSLAPKAAKGPKEKDAPKIHGVPFRVEFLPAIGPPVLVEGPGEKVNVKKTGSLFAAVLQAPPEGRYVYLSQLERVKEKRFLVFYMVADTQAGPVTRLPPAGSWTRALVTGTVHVHTSDVQLDREPLSHYLGGHEPPTTPAKPPYT